MMISEFAKEKVFWTRKMNLKLVKFIKSRQNIWNPKHPKYTSVEYRDQTYAEFANMYGNEFTGQAVKERWTNIRSTFANYLRKLKASQAKEDGDVYKVNWHLWDACSFLLTVNKKYKSSLSNESPEDETKDDIDIDNEDIIGEEYNNCSSRSINELDTTCQKIATGLLNVFRGVQNDIFDIDNTKYGKFGHTLASKLSQMNSFEAMQTSSKIMDILVRYHEDNPYNPNNMKSEGI